MKLPSVVSFNDNIIIIITMVMITANDHRTKPKNNYIVGFFLGHYLNVVHYNKIIFFHLRR